FPAHPPALKVLPANFPQVILYLLKTKTFLLLKSLFPLSPAAAMQGQKTAPVLVCPYEWVGYRNTCYYLSGWHEQGSWDWSQEQCSRHGASLAMVTRDWELVSGGISRSGAASPVGNLGFFDHGTLYSAHGLMAVDGSLSYRGKRILGQELAGLIERALN
uniref:C-type lectin domain-containing protein n=1 Tax=Anas platyrhynchos platyrhynchos TaxID=8840 RepID=A0A493TIQ7_ANAPP